MTISSTYELYERAKMQTLHTAPRELSKFVEQIAYERGRDSFAVSLTGIWCAVGEATFNKDLLKKEITNGALFTWRLFRRWSWDARMNNFVSCPGLSWAKENCHAKQNFDNAFRRLATETYKEIGLRQYLYTLEHFVMGMSFTNSELVAACAAQPDIADAALLRQRIEKLDLSWKVYEECVRVGRKKSWSKKGHDWAAVNNGGRSPMDFFPKEHGLATIFGTVFTK